MSSVLRALIVDDDPVARGALEEILRRSGFYVASVADARSGLAALEHSTFELCVVDIILPDASGLQLIEEVRRRPELRRTALFVITARLDPQLLVAAFSAGADEFAFKPFSGEELRVRARLCVQRRRESSALDVRGTSERRDLTALFCDVRGFTAMAKALDPEWVVEVLNGLFDRLVDDLERHGGRVDKFLGDGILAFFGMTGVAGRTKERAAVEAALEMITSTEAYSRESLVLEGRVLEVGVGIATGEVVVAPVGSRALRQVTAIGDAVNLASRLQSLARESEVLVCERTFERISSEVVHSGGRQAEIKGISGTPWIFPIIGVRPEGWLG